MERMESARTAKRKIATIRLSSGWTNSLVRLVMKSPLSIAKGHFSRELQNRDVWSVEVDTLAQKRTPIINHTAGGTHNHA